MANSKLTSSINEINSAISGIDIKKLYDVIAAMAAITGLSDTTKGKTAKMDFGISNDTFTDLKKYAKYLNENNDQLQEYIDKQQKIINNTKKRSKAQKEAKKNLVDALTAQNVSSTITGGGRPPMAEYGKFTKALKYTGSAQIGKKYDKELLKNAKGVYEIYKKIKVKYDEINSELEKKVKLLSRINNKRKLSAVELKNATKELGISNKKIVSLETEARLLTNTAVKYNQLKDAKRKGVKEEVDGQKKKVSIFKKVKKVQKEVTDEAKKEEKARKNILSEIKKAVAKYTDLTHIISRMTFVMTAAISYKVFEGFQRGISESVAGYIKLNDEINKSMTMLSAQEQMSFSGIYEEEIIEFIGEYTQSLEGLSKALYDTVSAQIGASNAMNFIEESAKAAIAGITTIDVAAEAGISTMRGMGEEVQNIADVYDFLFRIVELGRGTFADYAKNIGRLTNVASKAGLEANDLGAALATMTQSLKPDVAQTVLKQLILNLKEPTKELVDILRSYGYTLADISLETNSLAEVTKKLMVLNEQEIVQITGSKRGYEALATLMNNMNTYEEYRIKMLNRSGATMKAYNTRIQTTAHSWRQFTSNLQEFFIKISKSNKGLISLSVNVLKGMSENINTILPLLGTLTKAIVAFTATKIFTSKAVRDTFSSMREDVQLMLTDFRKGRAVVELFGGALKNLAIGGAFFLGTVLIDNIIKARQEMEIFNEAAQGGFIETELNLNNLKEVVQEFDEKMLDSKDGVDLLERAFISLKNNGLIVVGDESLNAKDKLELLRGSLQKITELENIKERATKSAAEIEATTKSKTAGTYKVTGGEKFAFGASMGTAISLPSQELQTLYEEQVKAREIPLSILKFISESNDLTGKKLEEFMKYNVESQTKNYDVYSQMVKDFSESGGGSKGLSELVKSIEQYQLTLGGISEESGEYYLKLLEYEKKLKALRDKELKENTTIDSSQIPSAPGNFGKIGSYTVSGRQTSTVVAAYNELTQFKKDFFVTFSEELKKSEEIVSAGKVSAKYRDLLSSLNNEIEKLNKQTNDIYGNATDLIARLTKEQKDYNYTLDRLAELNKITETERADLERKKAEQTELAIQKGIDLKGIISDIYKAEVEGYKKKGKSSEEAKIAALGDIAKLDQDAFLHKLLGDTTKDLSPEISKRIQAVLDKLISSEGVKSFNFGKPMQDVYRDVKDDYRNEADITAGINRISDIAKKFISQIESSITDPQVKEVLTNGVLDAAKKYTEELREESSKFSSAVAAYQIKLDTASELNTPSFMQSLMGGKSIRVQSKEATAKAGALRSDAEENYGSVQNLIEVAVRGDGEAKQVLNDLITATADASKKAEMVATKRWDAIKDLSKKAAQAISQAYMDSIQNEINLEKIRHQQKMDNMDEELDKKIKSIDNEALTEEQAKIIKTQITEEYTEKKTEAEKKNNKKMAALEHKKAVYGIQSAYAQALMWAVVAAKSNPLIAAGYAALDTAIFLKNMKAEKKAYSEIKAGFRVGGYTGDGDKDEVAGVVHKREVVFESEIVDGQEDDIMRLRQMLKSGVKASQLIQGQYRTSGSPEYKNTMTTPKVSVTTSADATGNKEIVNELKKIKTVVPPEIDPEDIYVMYHDGKNKYAGEY